MNSLTSYLSRFLRDAAALEKSITEPMLVYEPPADESSEDSLADHRFKTVSGIGSPAIGGGETLVLAIRKEKQNAFQRGVTVGRTSNNDLVIDDPSVSRFHAWFQLDEKTGQWSVADAGSKNGTQVSGERLRPKKPMPLERDARIRFGSIEVTFMPPKSFLRMLKTRTSGVKLT